MKLLIPRISYLACFRDRKVVRSHDHIHTVHVTSLFGLCRRLFLTSELGWRWVCVQNSPNSFRYVETPRATLLGRKSPGFCVGTGRIIALFTGTHRRTLFWFICIQSNFPHHVSFTIRRNEVLLSTPMRLNHWNTPTCSNKFTAPAYPNSRFERPASLSPD